MKGIVILVFAAYLASDVLVVLRVLRLSVLGYTPEIIDDKAREILDYFQSIVKKVDEERTPLLKRCGVVRDDHHVLEFSEVFLLPGHAL